MSKYATVETRLDASGHILTVTLNRLKQKNSFNAQLYNDLIAVLAHASAQASIVAVVITGGGGTRTAVVGVRRVGRAGATAQRLM